MPEEMLSSAHAKRALGAAQKRLEKIKLRAAQAEAALSAATAAAGEAEKRRDVSGKIVLGAFLISRARQDVNFARYCLATLRTEPFPPRSAALIEPVLTLLEELARPKKMPEVESRDEETARAG
jgi:hypothetical protein